MLIFLRSCIVQIKKKLATKIEAKQLRFSENIQSLWFSLCHVLSKMNKNFNVHEVTNSVKFCARLCVIETLKTKEINKSKKNIYIENLKLETL